MSALEIIRNFYPEDTPLRRLLILHSTQVRDKALSILENVFGEEHPYVARSYHFHGKIYAQKGEYDKAIFYLQKALGIRLKLYGETHYEVAASYFYLGSVYEQLGNYSEAIKYYEQAVAIDEATLGPEHPYTIEDRKTLETIKTKHNK